MLCCWFLFYFPGFIGEGRLRHFTYLWSCTSKWHIWDLNPDIWDLNPGLLTLKHRPFQNTTLLSTSTCFTTSLYLELVSFFCAFIIHALCLCRKFATFCFLLTYLLQIHVLFWVEYMFPAIFFAFCHSLRSNQQQIIVKFVRQKNFCWREMSLLVLNVGGCNLPKS